MKDRSDFYMKPPEQAADLQQKIDELDAMIDDLTGLKKTFQEELAKR